MVFNIVRAREFYKPPGTILRDGTSGLSYVVISCMMKSFWECLLICQVLTDGVPIQNNVARVHLPSLDWQIVSLPEQEPLPALTLSPSPVGVLYCRHMPLPSWSTEWTALMDLSHDAPSIFQD